MVQKTTELKTPVAREEPLIYTDNEVGNIITVMGGIYALDDAILNQRQLGRPETYVKPLVDIRADLGVHLKRLSSKAMVMKPTATDPTDQPQA